MICKNCGSTHAGTRALPGSGWIELILWLFALLPGVIYSIWRRGQRKPVCEACGSRDLVGLGTPAGKALAAQYGVSKAALVAAKTPRPPAVRPGFVLALVGILCGLMAIPWVIASL